MTETDKRKIAPLPLVIESSSKKKTLKSQVYKLRIDPTDNGSPTYEFILNKLEGGETPREVLHW